MSQVKIPMTKKQNSIYNFIKTYKNIHDVCPTYQEIADHFGIKSRSTIHVHIDKIEKKGMDQKNTWRKKSYCSK